MSDLREKCRQERVDTLSNRQAHADSPVVRTVSRMNHGSRVIALPSEITRQMWASVTSAKTVPVVMRYAFMAGLG